MIKLFLGIFKKNVKTTMDWKSVGNSLKGTNTQGGPSLVVAEDVDQADFRKRYQRLRFTACMAIFAFSVSLVMLVLSSSFHEFAFCFMSMLLFGMFYFRYAMIMWISRCCWSKWDRRQSMVTVNGPIFFKVLVNKPEQLLPLPLPLVGENAQ